MATLKIPQNNQNYFAKTFPLLDTKIASADWNLLLESGTVFDHNERNEFIALLPFPGKNLTVVIYADHYAIATQQTQQLLTTFAHTLHLADPKQIQTAIKAVFPFAQYKTPVTNSRFVLVPLEKATHGIWLNPAMIYQITLLEQRTIVEMTNGLRVVSPIQLHSLEKAAVNGLALHACFKRDFQVEWGPADLRSPLEFLQLTHTPFTSKLSRKKNLHIWHCTHGDLFAAFVEVRRQAAVADYCELYGYEPE